MAIIDKKQTRWYSKSTFDNLDKTTIPVGTEIQVAGEIEETDLTADLQTKINAKLTAPTTPMVDSFVALLADGTTDTVSIDEFSGKLYKHNIVISTSTSTSIFIYAILNYGASINTVELLNSIKNLIVGSPAYVDDFEIAVVYTAVIESIYDDSVTFIGHDTIQSKNATSITDIVTEL